MSSIASIFTKAYEGDISVPFELMMPDKVIGIVSGAIDLFLVNTSDNNEIGPFYHIKRFNAGSIIFGFDKSQLPEDTIIMARAHYDTELNIESWDDFFENAQYYTEFCAIQIDKWCEALTDLILITYASSSAISLTPGETKTVEENDTFISAKRKVIWAQLTNDHQGAFLSDANYTVNKNDKYIPITKLSWSKFSSGSEITTKSSKEMIKDPLFKASMLNFNHIVIEIHKINIENKALFQSVKVYEKIDSNINLTHVASSNLRNLLVPSKVTVQDITATDPVVKSCQIIAQQLGVHLQSIPPDKLQLPNKQKVEVLLNKSKIPIRMVLLRKNWYKENSGLLLAFTKIGNEPVALIPNKGKGYLMFDVRENDFVPVGKAQAEALDVQGLAVYKKLPIEPLTFGRFLMIGLQGQWHLVWTVLIFGFIASLLGLVTPLLTEELIDEIIPSANRAQLWWVAGAMFIALIATFMFNVARNYVQSRLRNHVGYQLEASLWDKIIHLPMSFHKKEASSETFIRANRFHQIRSIIGEGALEMLILGLFGISNLFLMFYLQPMLGMIGIIAGFIYIIFTIILTRLKLKFDQMQLEVERKQMSTFFQMVTGVAKIRITGSEVRAYSYWAAEFRKLVSATMSSQRVVNFVEVTQEVLPNLLNLVLYISVALFVLKEDLSTGTFISFSVAFVAFINALGGIMGTIIGLSILIPMKNSMSEILKAPLRHLMAEEDLAHFKGDIQISNLDFRYFPDTPMVLKNLNFNIGAGEYVAIVGSSGVGKSTLIRLLLGLDVPTGGSIYYDGKDIANLELSMIRKQFGAVLQNEQLFVDSIYKNIVGTNDIPESQVMEVIEAVGLDKDLEDMPMGLNTLLGIGGGGLSGGQKQRILIARAIIHKPKILLLDEATSAMDNQSQKLIIDTLEKLKATRIVIAHRLSTIINADKIICIHNGQVVEEGTYDELMELKGKFYGLAKQQIL